MNETLPSVLDCIDLLDLWKLFSLHQRHWTNVQLSLLIINIKVLIFIQIVIVMKISPILITWHSSMSIIYRSLATGQRCSYALCGDEKQEVYITRMQTWITRTLVQH